MPDKQGHILLETGTHDRGKRLVIPEESEPCRLIPSRLSQGIAASLKESVYVFSRCNYLGYAFDGFEDAVNVLDMLFSLLALDGIVNGATEQITLHLVLCEIILGAFAYCLQGQRFVIETAENDNRHVESLSVYRGKSIQP